jgi:hypothetical protein
MMNIMLKDPLERSGTYKTKNWRGARLKSGLIFFLDRFPLIGILTRRIWRIAKWLLLKFRWKLESIQSRDYALDIDKTHWLNPQIIRYSSLKEFDICKYKGKTIGGDWDRLEKRLEKIDIYVASKEVFLNGKKWDETVFYKRILARIKKGEFLWGCKNKSELDQRYRNIEILYHKIRNDGYKSQRELSTKDDYNPMIIDDEITVCVGRYGDLLFSNGAHRLSIAKIVGIKKVPVKVAVRHPRWMNFRKRVLLHAKKHGGKISHSITHPDLCHMSPFHKSEDRYRIIKENLSVKKGRLLDIGACWGYFCHKFEEEKFDCYAVENDRENLYFLKTLKRAENRNFRIIPKSILEYGDIKNLFFDVVLALNIFHHFLKNRNTYYGFIDLLQNLRLKEMFFEPHLPNEPQMGSAYRNYSNEEFVRFITQNSNLKNAQLIGEGEDGRKIYKLY